MNDKELKQYLKQCLQQETELDKLHNKEDIKKLGNAKLEETVRLCVEIMREQELTKKLQEEPRIGFARSPCNFFLVPLSQTFCKQCIDAHACPDATRYNQHLNRQRPCQRIYRILPHIGYIAGIRNTRHKHAVHDVVAGLQYH